MSVPTLLQFSPEEVVAIQLSLKVGIWAVAISLPAGIVLALVLARARFYGRELLDVVVHLPLILPPVVTGYFLLLAFGTRGPMGRLLFRWFGLVFAFRWTGAVLASAVVAFPLMVRAIRLSIEAVDRRLEDAAGTLGASPVMVFFTVTLPMILPGIIAGAILSFARSLGEFGATITFVSNIPGETQTLPTALYTFTQVPGGDTGAMRLTIVSVCISAIALLISEFLSRRVAKKVAGL